MKNKFFNIYALFLVALAISSCQGLDRPELGDYPKDASAPGGPLKFFTAFDGTTDNPLMNAVDSIRAKFPSNNPLKSINGISGKAVQGQNYKYIKYSSANDFIKDAKSLSVSVWIKKGSMKTDHIFSMPAVDGYHWSGSGMFLLTEGNVATPIVKFVIADSKGDKFFEWVGANSPLGLYDNNWHHLAFVYDGTTSKMTMYVDGVANAHVNEWPNHGNISYDPSKITGLKIGAGPQEFTAQEAANGADDWLKNSFDGGIDQFRLYTTALTSSEVMSLFVNKK